ncbi:MAG: hypothetical protein K2N51_05210 [Lachnospiraceae bacterium]|nr:hypothetical protein [Lachnospiraceae bacterium]
MMLVMTVSLVTGLKVRAATDSTKISLTKTTISVKKGITEKIKVKNKPTVFADAKEKHGMRYTQYRGFGLCTAQIKW